ncbi:MULTISPECIES: MATE family efflux transporter [unclassified Pseudomonas]|uniref:MATE family efflux transporter n=4 Tax=Pseudomonas TaxID=286 RepID=UPI000C869128|nr:MULTISPECIES: MATE family efflux transporter [unclassified Pseudomonas]PMV18066.1 MATE family efflux transporter [Pseudomonas sp. FW305-3-2-15-C-TSA2]PMV32870.1 MATE family efflux transporter [Pseudomonas sp. DP16D-L5]PMV42584.1 MATE family efflux transporter [Pseudomonas sp. FW305-3-2-15-A-LB2]PMV49378.1 MATE family efflux transporter [Pseudomonas sp. FW305-3-2-15-C-R2A1]PMV60034.1 MATE family efflux transporter [Pseudomonas sp. GW460-4]
MPTLLTDWRHRPTHRRVWALAAPMILSNISVPLVALVDSMVIGHLPHAHQLGAVAVGASLYTFLAWAMGFLRMGSTGFAAQAAGRNDGAALRQILLQGLLLALGLAMLLGSVGIPFSHLALEWMQPSPELNQLTQDFFHTRLFGLPAALASYALVGWFLGTQNARAPLAILLTTNLVNIALNLWFVLGLDWGVVGSARASVIAEWTGALLGLAMTQKALRAYPGHIAWAALKQWESWRPLLAVNRDIFIRSLALQSVFFMITVQGARLGDATVAANALLLNGLLLTAHALDGLAHAVEALCGHAIGAHDRQAMRRSLVVAGGWSLIASVGFALLFTVCGHLFIAMQTDIPSVRETADIYLPYLAVLPLIAVWSYLLDGLFIGATRAREMRNGMLLTVVSVLPVAWALQGLGNHGLWITFLVFMSVRSLLLWVIARRINRANGWFDPRLAPRSYWP